jgi:RHS repeat-associated protein
MRIKRDGTIRHYKQDALGSVIGLLDDTGIPKTGYTYDPFGNVTILGEPSDNPFQYTGRENDNTGLYYYRARYYSPELQRFISEDPIGFNGGSINLYEYVGNNPINYTDPKGLAYISGLGNICKTLYPNNTYVDRCFRKACMECIASGFGGGIPYMSSLFGFCITIKGTYNYYTGNCDCP